MSFSSSRVDEFSATNDGSSVIYQTTIADDEYLIAVQLNAVGSALNLIAEASIDGSNWYTLNGKIVGQGGGSRTSLTAVGLFCYPVQARYFRLRPSAGTGTVSGLVEKRQGWYI